MRSTRRYFGSPSLPAPSLELRCTEHAEATAPSQATSHRRLRPLLGPAERLTRPLSVPMAAIARQSPMSARPPTMLVQRAGKCRAHDDQHVALKQQCPGGAHDARQTRLDDQHVADRRLAESRMRLTISAPRPAPRMAIARR